MYTDRQCVVVNVHGKRKAGNERYIALYNLSILQS